MSVPLDDMKRTIKRKIKIKRKNKGTSKIIQKKNNTIGKRNLIDKTMWFSLHFNNLLHFKSTQTHIRMYGTLILWSQLNKL